MRIWHPSKLRALGDHLGWPRGWATPTCISAFLTRSCPRNGIPERRDPKDRGLQKLLLVSQALPWHMRGYVQRGGGGNLAFYHHEEPDERQP